MIAVAGGALRAGAQDNSAVRNLADPAACAWRPTGWNSAAGAASASTERPPASGSAAGSIRVAVDYSGKGFEFFSIEPVSGVIPGVCRKVSAWVKAEAAARSWAVKFKDGQGREEVGGHKLEMGLKTRPGEWVKTDFAIPADWVQPLTLVSIAGHNWGVTTDKAHAEILVHDLRVQTDVATVSDRKSLVHVSLTAAAENGVVLDGEPASWSVAADSWLGAPLTGTLAWTVRDEQGTSLTGAVRQMSFTETATETVTFQPPRYGVYALAADVRLENGVTFSQTNHMAYVPRPVTLSEPEKDASPYGLCIHGAMPGTPYRTASRLGFAWVRDYAYTWEWMLRAKGDDGHYAGWPWYPKMDQKARDAGLRVLPCLMKAMGEGVDAGRLEPDKTWKINLLHILMSFPQYTAWELDNEYDYRHGKAEQDRDWSSYKAYHRLFGQTLHFMDEHLLAVENGTAGLYPERVRKLVRSGAFDPIDVVNAHFYCGTRPPELARENANTGQDAEAPVMIADTLKDLAHAAQSDGRKRQTWITEFGWDTLAVHIVSEHEQAAYLQRGFMMILNAGIDRAFWYWDRDTKQVPNNFFDGCGLLDPREEPKPAAAAMAGLRQRLKLPRPVGTCDFGPNTGGYVLRDGNRLVGCAFKMDPAGPTATVEFPSGKLFDLYGNPLASRKQTLDIAPVWIDDIPDSDPMAMQTAYDLGSLRYVRATAGDPFTVQLVVRNTRASAIKAAFTTTGPADWLLEAESKTIDVAPGQTKTYPIRVTISAKAANGEQRLAVVVHEGGIEKTLAVAVDVLAYANTRAKPLSGTPGRSPLAVTLHNNSLQARTFVLKPVVPQSWKVEPAMVTLDAVGAESNRTAEFTVDWTTTWTPDEAAEVAVLTADGTRIGAAPISPGTIPLASVAGIKCDADVADWPAAARLPRWSLGCEREPADAEIYAGWSSAGLNLAVVVRNSKADVFDPKAFWGGDCFEVFVDTAGNTTGRKAYAPTDHQFWICPQVKEGRVFVGRWKRGNEIAATQYDLKDVVGASRKTADGYVMEVLLPAAELKDYAPAKGKHLGLNFNLTVHGANSTIREVYWPNSKADGAAEKPRIWGIAELK